MQLQQDGVYRPTVNEIEELAGPTVSWLMVWDLRLGTQKQSICSKCWAAFMTFTDIGRKWILDGIRVVLFAMSFAYDFHDSCLCIIAALELVTVRMPSLKAASQSSHSRIALAISETRLIRPVYGVQPGTSLCSRFWRCKKSSRRRAKFWVGICFWRLTGFLEQCCCYSSRNIWVFPNLGVP